MLKGCKRNIIMVKDTGSPYFDSAYFVLKCDLPASGRDTDIIAEARRMIECASSDGIRTVTAPPKKTSHSAAAWLAVCSLALFFVCAALLAFIIF